MRAVYCPEVFENETFELDKDKLHHFSNVLRLKSSEIVMVLDGKGNYSLAELIIESKKKGYLKRSEEIQIQEKKYSSSLVLGILKKDALDLALKNACELGFDHIILCETDYSQKYKINEARVQKICISAIEQSNNAYLPKVSFQKLSEINWSEYDSVYAMVTEEKIQNHLDTPVSKMAIVIGPEGGFGTNDYLVLKEIANINLINLPANILRAPNAVSCATGYVWGQISCKS